MEIEEGLGCVYFIKLNGLTPIKIGYSTHPTPSGRVDSFTVGAPFGVELVGFIQSTNAKQLESLLHKRFSAFRCNGEWFDISKEQARSCCEQYMDNAQKDKLSEAFTLISNSYQVKHATDFIYPTVFLDWVNVAISFDIRLCKKELYNSFIDMKGDFEDSLTQKKFTGWISAWASDNNLLLKNGKSGDLRWIIIKK